MRRNRIFGLAFGIILGVFCIGLIVVSIRIQMVQSKQQSPVYQEQIVLKSHTRNLAEEFYKYADAYDKLAIANNGQVWNFGMRFDNQFYEKTRTIQIRLDEEGRDTQKLSDFYYKASETSRGMNRNPLGDEVRAISNELTNLSNQLPTENH